MMKSSTNKHQLIFSQLEDYFRNNNFKKVINLGRKYKKNIKSFKSYNLIMASSYFQIEDFKKAIYHAQNENHISKKNLSALYIISLSYYKIKEYNLSEEWILKYLSLQEDAQIFTLYALVKKYKGDIKGSNKFFLKSYTKDPHNEINIINFKEFCVQFPYQSDNIFNHRIKCSNIKYILLNCIEAILQGNFKDLLFFYEELKAHWTDENLKKIHLQDKNFCVAYARFIQKMIPYFPPRKKYYDDIIYHIGESHCLSFAHQIINFNNLHYRIHPKICFGTKAYHLGDEKMNKYKGFVIHHFNKIPPRSKVFLSFGEIDCRENEGFLSALKSSKNDVEIIIQNTISRFVEFINSINLGNFDIYFLTVPAPIYNIEIDPKLNEQVRKIVKNFNAELQFFTSEYKFQILDTYVLTKNEHGFSNETYHSDRRHLSPDILGPLFESN